MARHSQPSGNVNHSYTALPAAHNRAEGRVTALTGLSPPFCVRGHTGTRDATSSVLTRKTTYDAHHRVA
jgi:hypothetical protein